MSFSRDVHRRDFLKTLLAAGAGAALSGKAGLAAESAAKGPALVKSKVPTRSFGKTGVQVSCLGLGGMFDTAKNQLVLRRARDLGVTYWDAADCYNFGGPSEIGSGNFFAANPGSRKEIFLVTKSDARDPAGIDKLLARSLERLQTDYIDLYFIHGIHGISELNDDTKSWAEKAKKAGKIKFFGFSTHSNMEDCLSGAAKLGWVDGIMFSYNYRLMQKSNMKAAVEACAKAGIGLTAMKTQGGGSVKADSQAELDIGGIFLNRGFTDAQAKLKAVWENPQIACICSQMPTLAILTSNVAASMNLTKLATAELDRLEQHAAETREGYCAGCGEICAAAAGVPVNDVMRHLMYHHSYGDPDLARSEFARLPADIRARLATLDFSDAERRCPQGMPIAQLMKEAAELLA